MGKARERKKEHKGRQSPSPAAPQPTVEDLELALLEYVESPEISKEYREALALLGEGQLAEAVSAIDAIRQRLKEENALVLTERLARLYVQHGVVHPALKIFRQVDQDEDAPDAKTLNILAMEYAHVSRFDEQRRLYLKRGQVFGDSARNRVEIAWTYELEKRFDLAQQELEKALEVYPVDSFAAQQLILIYLRLGQRDKASEVCRAVLQIESEDEAVDFDKAIAALILRRPKEALRFLEKPLAVLDDPFPFYYSALAHLMLGDGAKASEFLQTMAKYRTEIWDQDEELLARSFLTRKEYEALTRLWPRAANQMPSGV